MQCEIAKYLIESDSASFYFNAWRKSSSASIWFPLLGAMNSFETIIVNSFPRKNCFLCCYIQIHGSRDPTVKCLTPSDTNLHQSERILKSSHQQYNLIMELVSLTPGFPKWVEILVSLNGKWDLLSRPGQVFLPCCCLRSSSPCPDPWNHQGYFAQRNISYKCVCWTP